MRRASLVASIAIVLMNGSLSSGVGAAPVQGGGQQSLGKLLQKMRANGRAEAALERSAPDPMSGRPQVTRGRIALEPPDRADVRLPGGERIVLRGDGGEWVQPELEQLLRFGAESAASAQRWSRYLMTDEGARLKARRVGPREFVVAMPSTEGVADSARVWLDATGLPARLDVDETGEGVTTYRFSGWRFAKAQGRPAFVIQPPKGYEVVALP